MRIFKYPLQITNEQTVRMPQGAEVLSVDIDPQGQLCVWAIVDPSAPMTNRGFNIHGTGHPLPEERDHLGFIGTVVFSHGLVFHIFEHVR